MFDYQNVKLVCISEPKVEGVKTIDEFIAYVARVSNPGNQLNTETAPKLLNYLMRNKHWSPFEMVHICMEVKTTRDIGRQILRHGSFKFQEFSQRYAQVTESTLREVRLQDSKNRQNSIETDDDNLGNLWMSYQDQVRIVSDSAYKWALEHGIAKEQARVVLPEGMTMSTLYMAGSLRSWIHYCQLRCSNGTQKEHQDIALKAWDILKGWFPSLPPLEQ